MRFLHQRGKTAVLGFVLLVVAGITTAMKDSLGESIQGIFKPPSCKVIYWRRDAQVNFLGKDIIGERITMRRLGDVNPGWVELKDSANSIQEIWEIDAKEPRAIKPLGNNEYICGHGASSGLCEHVTQPLWINRTQPCRGKLQPLSVIAEVCLTSVPIKTAHWRPNKQKAFFVIPTLLSETNDVENNRIVVIQPEIRNTTATKLSPCEIVLGGAPFWLRRIALLAFGATLLVLMLFLTSVVSDLIKKNSQNYNEK